MSAISLVVITYNEETNIERCLSSAADLVDEILVVDSFSTDKTLELAEALGARIIKHPFAGHKEQKEYAIAQAKNDRILTLDADEALDEKLILEVVRSGVSGISRGDKAIQS